MKSREIAEKIRRRVSEQERLSDDIKDAHGKVAQAAIVINEARRKYDEKTHDLEELEEDLRKVTREIEALRKDEEEALKKETQK